MHNASRNYRAETLRLRASSLLDLQRVWPTLAFADLDRSFPGFLAATSTIIQRDRAKVSGAAVDYLDRHRRSAGVPGKFSARLAGPAPARQIASSITTTSLVAAKVAIRSGQGEQAAMAIAFTQTAGAVSRLILNAGRETVTATTIADPRAVGWQRVGIGRCDFCQMLLGRGDVYTEASADFQAHDGCTCGAEPVYS